MTHPPTHTMSDNKHQRWAFTAYEPEWAKVDELAADQQFVKMLKYQTEVCPSTGRRHRQGCLITQRPIRFNALRSRIAGVHIEPAKNWTALLAYCEKAETRDASGASVSIDNTSFKPKRLNDFMMDIAVATWELWDISVHSGGTAQLDNPPTHTPLLHKKDIMAEYWEAVKWIILTVPEAIGMYAQPMPQTAWVNTREVWLRRVRNNREAEGLTIGPD